MNRRTFIGAGGLAVLGSLAGCVGIGLGDGERVTSSIDRTFSSPDIGELRIDNAIGDISVIGQGTGGVEVTVLKSARNQRGLDDIQVAIDDVDGVLSVVASLDTGTFSINADSPTADIAVTVPASGPGPVVRSVIGGIGDITVMGTRGDATILTNLGDITVADVDGYLSLSSELGSITATGVSGLDDVHTELGDVTVDVLSIRQDLSIGTNLGTVRVGVADDLDLEVLAETDGGLTSNLPLVDSRMLGSRLTGRLNGGGHRLHAFSDLGDVSLRSITR